MVLGKAVSAEDAVALIRDGDVVATSGYGGNGAPNRSTLRSGGGDGQGFARSWR
jgi:acyl CoA:acetate/3-ketoacid CoA transferase alpha subunit